ncbi:surface lipoprotein assembly modifier [Acinetobacter baumannii]|uniref:surface lipoprotein assembly modifier n=1 Tax=Acinetobacter baumannii TaxID=470 RepID=UPI002940C014|nr:surface lipoprotein assembly modifier [Acinetobacter baumannii]MDV4273814.1 surface lipoprotein assembly modifier [Acinetobacter baumannii]
MIKKSISAPTLFLFGLFFTKVCLAEPQVNQPLQLPQLTIPQIQTQQPEIKSNLNPQINSTDEKMPELNDEDLKNNVQLTQYIINQALAHQDWNTLQRINKFYPAMQGADPMLVKYVQGTLYRQQAKHKKAIAAYQWMLNQEPTLHTVRFDLAAMQFENKQYKDAQHNFEIVQQTKESPDFIQHLIKQYLQAIDQQSQLSGTLQVGVAYNDNVNQGNDINTVLIQDLVEFEKSPDSLARSSWGYDYNLHLNKDWNIYKNHFLTLNSDISTDLYSSLPEYNEYIAQIKTGYKFQNVNSWLKIEPFISKRFLDNNSYSQDMGLQTEYGRWLQKKWQVIGNLAWIDRNYNASSYAGYEGNNYLLSGTAVHFLKQNQIVFAGLNYQQDKFEDTAESSKRYGVQFGAIQQWPSGWLMRINAGVGYKKYEDINVFKLSIRKDKEYQAGFSLENQAWQWNGFTPKLAYSFIKVDSNQADIYSKKINQLTLSLETSF